MKRVAVIVDDHPMCRQATMMALQVVDPEIAIIEAESLGVARMHAEHAALMTLDLGLPDNNGMLGLSTIREQCPTLPLLVITGTNHPDIERRIAAAGANGYLSKAARISEMVEALRTVLSSRQWFTPDLDSKANTNSDFSRFETLTNGQIRVLRAMESGRLNKQIAFDLGLSEITIKAHVKVILRKLAVHNRTQAIIMYRQLNA